MSHLVLQDSIGIQVEPKLVLDLSTPQFQEQLSPTSPPEVIRLNTEKPADRRGGTVNHGNPESRFDVNGPVLGATGDAWIASADAISMDFGPLTGDQATPGGCIQIDN